MRTYLLFFFLLVYSSIVAQPIYQPFEVDSAARPQGGSKALDDFVVNNIRIPITAQTDTISGRIFLTGVVETNGILSNVRVSRGLRPDCDQEALRILRLFKAWRPAIKDGKPVRQTITYTLLFPKDTPIIYSKGARICYFDENWNRLTDSLSYKVRYKAVIPMQNNWLPTGDIVQYKRRSFGLWQEIRRYRYVRQELKRKTTTGKRIYRLGHLTATNEWYDNQYEVDEDGTMLSLKIFDSKGLERALTFAEDGTLVEFTRRIHELTNRGFIPTMSTKRWYLSGQKQVDKTIYLTDNIERVRNLWDAHGVRLVANGNGQITFTDTVRSYADSTKQTIYTETGTYQNRLKQGVWTGRFADGSYFYEEVYENGICKQGKAIKIGGDTIRYTTVNQEPEFIGGKSGLMRFLKQNLHYPLEAQKSQTTGEVLVDFTICADGTSCEYNVLESVDPVLDQEAIRLVQAMSGQWKPGVLRGEKTRMRFRLPINFALK